MMKCLVMNNMTRYNFIIYGLKKGDFKQFDEIIVNEIANNLKADKVKETHRQKYINKCGQVSYTSTNDRSIISQINEMIRVSKYKMEADKVNGIETDIYKLNRFLNGFIMLKLPELYSGETMRSALQSL
ncbi:DUF6933 domain-containing protein [Bacillus methanolicus]|uniref:DUF6933 domain-containing protein n=1 Tax=Bacillus methanolicus (strain MGA3 / ATCC 53907) TaxID=796606 RepID=A0A068LWR8_BACMM|nr:hypothetical protein BMMGA3_07845 [Bacillus methanolicus MGA3]